VVALLAGPTGTPGRPASVSVTCLSGAITNFATSSFGMRVAAGPPRPLPFPSPPPPATPKRFNFRKMLSSKSTALPTSSTARGSREARKGGWSKDKLDLHTGRDGRERRQENERQGIAAHRQPLATSLPARRQSHADARVCHRYTPEPVERIPGDEASTESLLCSPNTSEFHSGRGSTCRAFWAGGRHHRVTGAWYVAKKLPCGEATI